LNLVDRILLLREVPLFSRASIQTLTSLGELAQEVSAGGDDILFARGEMAGRLLVVADGQVIATRTAPGLVARFARGSLVCGASAIDDMSPYEVRAAGATRTLSIAVEDCFDVMEEHFGLVRSALMALAEEREMLLDREPLAPPSDGHQLH
jgi:CRP-like cAMP-binding protein